MAVLERNPIPYGKRIFMNVLSFSLMNPNRTFMPSLRQLLVFRSVYQLRKISAAAEQLSLTQSAVSMVLKQMEEGFGIRLFERTTRSLRPTPAAEEALVAVERILRDVEFLGAGLRDLSQLRRGSVSVAVTPTLGEIVLPVALERFRQAHPGIRVIVDDCAPDQFVSRITGEQVDFGIGTPEEAAADVDTTRLISDQLAVVCRQDHPLADKTSVRWRDLKGHPVITVRPGYGIRPLIDRSAAAAGVALDIAAEVSYLSTAVWMVQAGQGLAIMPSAYARDSQARQLVVHKLSRPTISRDIAIVSKRGRTLPAAARAFIEELERAVGSTHETRRRA